MSDKVKKGRLKAAAAAAIVFLAILLVLGALEWIVSACAGRLSYLGAGKRWSSDGERYAVINAYMEDGCGVNSNTVDMWAYSINNALTEASIDATGDARPWTWCASFDTNLRLTGPKNSANAEVMVCAGDFFVFREMKFVSGSGFLNDRSNPMGVVLDDDLAWKLFGAVDIAGMTLTINDIEYTVTGVTKPDSEKGVYGYTYGDSPRMYMSAAGYERLGMDYTFTVYETALPNPVKGFAKNIFDGTVSLNEDKSDVIEATDRFSLRSRFENMKKLKYSWISVNRIEYPYWENEARVYDYRCAVLMILEIIVAAIGVIALLAAVILVVISGYSPITTVKNTFAKLSKKIKKKKLN